VTAFLTSHASVLVLQPLWARVARFSAARVRVTGQRGGQTGRVSPKFTTTSKAIMNKEFKISEVKAAAEFLRSLNEVKLDELVLIDDNGEAVDFSAKIARWRFIGLNNRDFVLAHF
jgi:hypothetical protein